MQMTMTRVLMTTAALGLMAACDTPLDFDLRDLAKGFDTSESVANLPERPRADGRGVISYPNYQVVVAKKDDTMISIASRLGLSASELAGFNGIGPDVALRRGELVALPKRVTEPSPATGAAQTGPIQPSPVDVTAIATTALDRAGPQAATPTAPMNVTVPTAQTGTEPVRHKVKRGETVFSISRFYDVPVRAVAQWNALGPELNVREGQFLLIPQAGQTAPVAAPVSIAPAPGAGSETPVPPSAVLPLPDETPSVPVPAASVPDAPDLGVPTPTQTPAASTALFAYPVQGSIIRAYASGRNEGIDISVAAGTSVKAAGAGSVAAVTTDTSGVAIVVIKHDGGLLTVYTNLEGLTVAKGASVSKGQAIGKVRAGDPSFLHFEVRRGLTSVDPAEFLP
jgi:lipoprotein NlpD